MSFFKKTLKFIILALFIVERVLYYEELRGVVKPAGNVGDKVLHHHQFLHGVPINFSKVNEKFNTHQLFGQKHIKPLVEKAKKLIIQRLEMDGVKSNHTHTHGENEKFSDVVANPDLKLNFYFLTGYDILVLLFLIIFLSTDSLFSNMVLLAECSIRVLTLGFRQISEFKYDEVLDSVYKFVQEILKKDFASVKRDLENFVDKEKMLALNIALLYLFFLLFFYLLVRRAFFSGGRNVNSAGQAGEGINKTMKEIENTEGKKEQDRHNKVEKKPSQPRSRDGTPSKRRMNKGTHFKRKLND